MSDGIGRRALLGGCIALAGAGLRAAHAAGQVVIAAGDGRYAQVLGSVIGAPLLQPLGIDLVQDPGPAESRRAKLIGQRGARRGSVDVVCLSDIDMYALSLLGLFHPVTATDVPLLPHALPALRVPYAIPQMASALVVVYRPERGRPAPRSFADLWSEKWRGRAGFADPLYLYVFAAATLAAGRSMQDFAPGKQHLLALKAAGLKTYPSDEALGAALNSGEVGITTTWLANAATWQKAGMQLAHAVPEEGAIPVVRQAAVPKNAPDRLNGFTCLNAMLDPKAQEGFAAQLGFLPTVDNARLPRSVAGAIDFTAGQQARFRKPDYDYTARNAAQLLDFWNTRIKQ
jgi:putative spermidine/putrescine transport system substrate-binding protein